MNFLTNNKQHEEIDMANDREPGYYLYFLSEISKAEEMGMEIYKFVISCSDFEIMRESESLGINFNYNKAFKNDPIGSVFGCFLFLKNDGEIESYYKYPDGCGYLGVSTKERYE
jgi:hypothetical protein